MPSTFFHSGFSVRIVVNWVFIYDRNKASRSSAQPPVPVPPPAVTASSPQTSSEKASSTINGTAEEVKEKPVLPPRSKTVLPPTLHALDTDVGNSAASSGKAKKVMDWFRKKSLAKNVDSPFAPPSEHRPRHAPVHTIFAGDKSTADDEPPTPTLDTYRGSATHVNSSSSTINNTPQVVVTPADGKASSANWAPSPRVASGQSATSTDSGQSTSHTTNSNTTPSTPNHSHLPPVAKRAAEAIAQVAFRHPTKAFNSSMLRVHHGAVDQATITSGAPPEVFEHVTQVLLAMGIDLHRESQYKYRCIRQKRKRAATGGSGHGKETSGLSAFSMHGSAASNGVCPFFLH